MHPRRLRREALSCRAALFGAVTVAGASAAAVVPVVARAVSLSANDARFVELADTMWAIHRVAEKHIVEHHGREPKALLRAAGAERFALDRLVLDDDPPLRCEVERVRAALERVAEISDVYESV